MSLRKHTDYNSYLTNLKYNNLGNYLSERNLRFVESQINSLNNTVNKDNATSKNAIEGGESPFDILETQ